MREEAIGGLAAGVTGTVIGYPLDLVKTRMQTGIGGKGGIMSIGFGIVRQEGLRALYKGMAPPLISLTILNTTTFTMYSEIRTKYRANVGFDISNGLAGATTAPFAAIVSTVENFIKTQMQLDNVSKRQYRSSFNCLISLANSNGISVIYTGFTVNMIREMSFLSTYFYMYEGLRETLLKNAGLSSQLAVPVAGGLSGAMGWFISFPLDCIRAGVQGQSMSVPYRERQGAVKVMRALLRDKGVSGLYSGVTPSIARAFLVSGSRFSAYEVAIYLLTGKRYHDGEIR